MEVPASAKYAIIREMTQRDNNLLNIAWLCVAASVSQSVYYHYLETEDLRRQREEQDQKDFLIILEAYQFRGYDKGARGIYMRFLHMDPPVHMNIKKIRRLMNKYGLFCPIRKANPYRRMAKALRTSNVAPNLLKPEFETHEPRAVLLTDITCIINGEAPRRYMSTIIDACIKELLAWVLSESLEIDFVLETVNQLIENYGISLTAVTLINSDQGSHYGIESERRIEQEIQVNMAYRWFLGLDLDERVPDHSTISQNRRRRFHGESVFRSLFEHILHLCMEKGLVDGKVILTDSTHVKANASFKANAKVFAERETMDYMERLDQYEAEERGRLESSGAIKGQRTGRGKKEAQKTEKTVSATDPDAGMLRRPGKPEGMHYLSHQSVDAAHGIVVDVAVTPGNANDSEPYWGRIEYMREHLGLDIKTAGADGAYGTSMIYRAMEDMGIQLHTPNTTGGAIYKVEFRREDFRYDAEKDRFLCPARKALTLRSLERENYNVCRIYRADRKDCRACPMFQRCERQPPKPNHPDEYL